MKTWPFELSATPATSPKFISGGNLRTSITESKGISGATDCGACAAAATVKQTAPATTRDARCAFCPLPSAFCLLPYSFLHPRCQLRLQHFNRLLHLHVTALQIIPRCVVDEHIRRHAVVLHVLARARPDARTWRANRRTVEQRIRSRSNHRSHRGHADDLAESERLETGREHLGI